MSLGIGLQRSAGQPGKGGHKDGPGDEALFYDPYSLDIDPKTGMMYVADRMNNAIRRIAPPKSSGSTPTVTTVAGGPDGPEVPTQNEIRGGNKANSPEQQLLREQLTDDTTISTASINFPQALRLDSKGNVIIAEDSTRSVRRVNFATGKVERIGWMPDNNWNTWVWLDVDAEGVIGPKRRRLSSTIGITRQR